MTQSPQRVHVVCIDRFAGFPEPCHGGPPLLLGQTLGAVRKPVLDIGTGPGFLALGLVTDKTCRLLQPENIQLLPAIDGFQSRQIFVAAAQGNA